MEGKEAHCASGASVAPVLQRPFIFRVPSLLERHSSFLAVCRRAEIRVAGPSRVDTFYPWLYSPSQPCGHGSKKDMWLCRSEGFDGPQMLVFSPPHPGLFSISEEKKGPGLGDGRKWVTCASCSPFQATDPILGPRMEHTIGLVGVETDGISYQTLDVILAALYPQRE